ncbi:MAG: hypothetical protein KQI78_25040 [Deltaproteobacteria bacterium]|nr:hypothetical protein [Deltaproteobacteria bacterium]
MKRMIILLSGIMIFCYSDFAQAAAPDAPTLSVFTSGLDVTASWTSVSGATGYTLYYAPYPYAGEDTIGSLDMGTSTTFSISLWDGASYYVAIKARDGNGESGYSNIELFIIDSLTSITNTWIWLGGPIGGKGYDIRMSPDDPDTMYVTDALAGVFKSTDGGRNWSPINEGISVRAGLTSDQIPVFCATIDPNDADTLWVGMFGTRGLFKSTDGGQNWTARENGIVESAGLTFRGITIDPCDSNTVYAAGEVASYIWSGSPRESSAGDMTMGVVYKTTTGGDTWTAIWRGNNLARYVWLDPRDSKVIYVSTGIFDRDAADSKPETNTPGGVGILKSIDGGATWQQMNTGLQSLFVGSLYMHPVNPDILLAGVGVMAYPDGSGIYRTADGGSSWVRVLDTEPIISVEFSTLDPTIAYAGGKSTFFRSEDAGLTWAQVNAESPWGPPRQAGGFPIDLQVDPRDSDRLFANSYGGGNFLSTDGGSTWVDASHGYTGAGVLSLSIDSTDPDRVLAGVTGGIYLSTDGGRTWPSLSTADGWRVVAIDPANSNNLFGGVDGGGLMNSTDGGLTWCELLSVPGYLWRDLVFAPSQPSVLYVGCASENLDNEGKGIYVSLDSGQTWQTANDATSASVNVWAIAVSHADSQVVYVATSHNGVIKTVNGGTTWQTVNEGLPTGVSMLSIAVDPDDGQTVFVGGEGGLYVSKDGGTFWQSIVSGLPAEAVVTNLVINEADPRQMYLTERASGIYQSVDQGKTWALWNQGLKNRDTFSIRLTADGSRLYAGSNGSGAYRMNLDL